MFQNNNIIPSPLESKKNKYIKRIFDIIVSLFFVITLLWWVYIVVFIRLKFTTGGPVIFTQKRTGKNGKTFKIYKFSTMRENTEADTKQATNDDPRCTKWGSWLRKICVDELPQLINILKGDMSLVGPRPHMLYHTDYYSSKVNGYMQRLQVKPGLTGWAQVNGCQGPTPELWMMQDRIDKDLWYIRNWSLLLDIKIIYKEYTLVVKRIKK